MAADPQTRQISGAAAGRAPRERRPLHPEDRRQVEEGFSA